MRVFYNGFGLIRESYRGTDNINKSEVRVFKQCFYLPSFFLFKTGITLRRHVRELFLNPLTTNDAYHHEKTVFIPTTQKGVWTPFEIRSDKDVYTPEHGNVLILFLDSNKPIIESTRPEYLNENHSTYSIELSAAIETWETVLQSNPLRPKRGTRKSLIEQHLAKKYPNFNQSQRNRITGILNPDKGGGAPKIE